MPTADAGYEVIEESASEAMACISEHPAVCLVITDVQMPDIEGLTFARHVAAHWPEIAVVVASGAVTPCRGELPAIAKFVAKPFSPRQMVEAIQYVRSFH
jgi:CheY-like chemotaxis protein